MNAKSRREQLHVALQDVLSARSCHLHGTGASILNSLVSLETARFTGSVPHLRVAGGSEPVVDDQDAKTNRADSMIPDSHVAFSRHSVGFGNDGAAPRGSSLEIFFIDVQGGAATLIVTPERESILIDSGWPGLEDRDPKRIVHALKDLAGCDHLDHLITTHWHMDHFGGVAGLDRLVRIGRFWDRGLPEDPDARR